MAHETSPQGAAVMAEITAAARAHDPERYLAALLAPRPARADLVTLAAFTGEMRRIPRIVSEPHLGEIRLQWWYDAVSAGAGAKSGNPLADALTAMLVRRAIPAEWLTSLIDARRFDLYAEGIADDGEFERYLSALEAGPMRAAHRIAGGDAALPPDAALDPGATALALTRTLVDLPYHLARGHWPLPSAWPEVAALGSPASAAPAAPDAVRRACDSGIADARRRLGALRVHLGHTSPATMAALLPCALIEPYLQALQRVEHDPARHLAEISPLRRVWRLWRASRTGWV